MMHVTKSATAEASDRKDLEAMPTFIQPSRRRFFPDVRSESFERTQNGVTFAWHESSQSISIEGQNSTGVCFPPGRPTKDEHPSLDQDPIKVRRTTSEASNTATPTASVNPYGHPKAKSGKSKAAANLDNMIQSADKLRNAQGNGSTGNPPKMPFLPQSTGPTLAHKSARCGTPQRAASTVRMQ